MSDAVNRMQFWRGRRVFLTGHTGFKGSWLCAWLLELGADLGGYALAPASDSVPDGFHPLFEELGLSQRMVHHVGDVREEGALRRALRDFAPEIVIHLAAQPLVRASYANPVETYATNVMGTVNLLDACRNLPELRCILNVTSDKCYENTEQIWGYRESDPMGGHDPYSSSKGCAELVSAAYRASYFPIDRFDAHRVVLATARAGNVIGGGDWSPDRLIPDAMRSVLRGRALQIRNPHAYRPWQHVLEPLSGYLKLIEQSFVTPETCAAGWNFGPAEDTTVSVGDMIEFAAETWGSGFRWTLQDEISDLHEATRLKLDCSAARDLLGWRARLTWQEAVAMTLAWYAAETPALRRSVMADQIARYTALGNALDTGPRHEDPMMPSGTRCRPTAAFQGDEVKTMAAPYVS